MARQNRSLSMGFTDIEPRTNTPTNEGTNEPTNPETIESTNAPAARSNERTYQPTESRRRYSFDLRPSVHKALKTECVLDDLNMYEVVENLIMKWVEERKRERGQ